MFLTVIATRRIVKYRKFLCQSFFPLIHFYPLPGEVLYAIRSIKFSDKLLTVSREIEIIIRE